MTITIKLNEEDTRALENYAKLKNQPLPQIMREATLAQMEAECDLKCEFVLTNPSGKVGKSNCELDSEYSLSSVSRKTLEAMVESNAMLLGWEPTYEDECDIETVPRETLEAMLEADAMLNGNIPMRTFETLEKMHAWIEGN